MPENIIIQPNKPLYVRLSDPMNTDNFNFETREGKFETSTGQVLTLPRPAVLRLYILEPAPGEEIEILKKWSGRRGDTPEWIVRRPAEPFYTAAGGWTPAGIKEQERRAQETSSAPGDPAAPDSPNAPNDTNQQAPTPIRRPSRQPAREAQPGLFDRKCQPTCNANLLPGEAACNCTTGPGPQKGTGTYGPMPAGIAYATPRLVPARRPPAEVIPWNVAFKEVSAWVEFHQERDAQVFEGAAALRIWLKQTLPKIRKPNAEAARQCRAIVAGRIGPWERAK